MKIVSVLIFFSISFYEICALKLFEYGRAVQIVSSFNHSLNLIEENIDETFQSANINDHHAVVVSMVGEQGGGKSFLMNLFIRFLQATYTRQNISDWRRLNETLNGFDYVNKTQGIWMWSEMFTHQFKNGEKIAIILLDTQGLFNIQQHAKEDEMMFTLNSMIASIQCVNLMRIIKRSDEKYFNLSSKHNDLVPKDSSVEVCENRHFIVRDKPKEIVNFTYGWQKPKQSFGSEAKFGPFYMPSPGYNVTENFKFDGNLKNVQPEFLDNVEKLALELFSPENLTVKKFNGKKMQVGDFVTYLKTSLHIFEGKLD